MPPVAPIHIPFSIMAMPLFDRVFVYMCIILLTTYFYLKKERNHSQELIVLVKSLIRFVVIYEVLRLVGAMFFATYVQNRLFQ